jgi:hypothetical protein
MDEEKKSFTFDELVGGSQSSVPTSKPVESTSKPKGMTLDEILASSAKPDEKPRRAEKDIFERGKEVLKETGVSGVAGYFAPEILTGLGMASTLSPITAPATLPLLNIAQGMRLTRGARALSAAGGALSGAVGETSGQTAEAFDQPQYKAELARMLGSTLTPTPSGLTSTAGGVLSKVASIAGFPGLGKARTIGALLEKEGFTPSMLSQEQTDFINKKLEAVRGGRLPGLQAQQDISEMLRRGASSIQQAAEREAVNLERQAAQEIEIAMFRGGVLDATAQQRVSNLQSQLNASADKIRSAGQSQANQILQSSQQRAQQVIDAAAQQSPNVRRIAQIDADALISEGRKRADEVLAAANQRQQRMRDISIRLRETGARRVAGATASLGEAKARTDIGEDIRSSFDKVLSRLKEQREEAAKINRQNAFGEAFQREADGQNVTETQAARNAIQEINATITNPVSGLKGVSEGALKDQLTRVRKAFEPEVFLNQATGETTTRAPSFENLEIVRRSLRDRASGLPAEGFDAIGVGQAKRLAELVEGVQKEFSPKFGMFLESYKELSRPINKFSSDVGKAITGRADYDFKEFAVDPALLADNLFASRRGVQQLINTVGEQQAETIARSYVQSRLGKGTAKEIQSVADDSKIQDWIGSFPALQKELNAALGKRGRAERIAEKRQKLAGALRTDIRSLPVKAATEAQRIEQDLLRAAERRAAAGEKEAAGLMTGAEREAALISRGGETAAEQARAGAETQITQAAKGVERQAGRLREEAGAEAATLTRGAEAKAKELTGEAKRIRDAAESNAKLLTAGDKVGESRVRDLILTENEKELQETAKVILANPTGKARFEEAVGQVFSDLAASSPKNANQRWKYTSQALKRAGLIDDAMANDMTRNLQDLLVSPISQAERGSLIKGMFKNFVIGYAVPGATRVMSLPFTQERTENAPD